MGYRKALQHVGERHLGGKQRDGRRPPAQGNAADTNRIAGGVSHGKPYSLYRNSRAAPGERTTRAGPAPDATPHREPGAARKARKSAAAREDARKDARAQRAASAAAGKRAACPGPAKRDNAGKILRQHLQGYFREDGREHLHRGGGAGSQRKILTIYGF